MSASPARTTVPPAVIQKAPRPGAAPGAGEELGLGAGARAARLARRASSRVRSARVSSCASTSRDSRATALCAAARICAA
ncbi:MAG: hypothetical protein E6K27_00545 [Gammaproteobacteria bacterium]|nr:MAG: hypothetical protein E6K27_00545 [Gammaproteobacteria bacterium]